MTIFDRIATLAKANINDLIDKAEDPEKVAKQVIYDLEQILRESSAGLAAAIAEEKRLQGQIRLLSEDSDKWEKRAATALEKEDEALAREALKRKLEADEEAARHEEYLEKQSERVKDLRSNLKTLEAQIEDAKRRRDALIARNNSAEAQKKMAMTMSKASSANPMEALDRMEAKVMLTEAKAEAFGELKRERMEDKFKAMDQEDAVSEALAALKEKVKVK